MMKKTGDEASAEASPQLVYSRRQAARLLGGISVFTLARLEKQGLLTPVRLGRSMTSQVFYRRQDLLALIEKGRFEASSDGANQ